MSTLEASDVRFEFGQNWRSFLERLDDSRIAEAEKSLQRLLGLQRLDGLRFLDIGSGSGLFSLAARRLGAAVHSFDYDVDSVACTAALRDRYFPGDPAWRIERGSVLDRVYLGQLGKFDIVYSWGVLHHTGAMHEALENASRAVGPGGTLAFALYGRTALCWAWTREKRWYVGASPVAQRRARSIYVLLMRLRFRVMAQDFRAYVESYRSDRGMNFQHDVHDWMGGYPYESIHPSEVSAFMHRIGFEHVRSITRPTSLGLFGSGCNEYVYRCGTGR